MKNLWTLFIISLFFTACSTTPQNEYTVNTSIDDSPVEGVDSVMTISLNDHNGSRELYKIAMGGNLDYLSDTVIYNTQLCGAIICLADYFQDDQVMFTVSDLNSDAQFVSERLRLPVLGLDMSQYRNLTVVSVTRDSISVADKVSEMSTTVALSQMSCGVDYILNYYEFQ